MKAGTIQIAWHGCDPVLSLDFHPVSGLLATSGADHDIKLWVLSSEPDKPLTKVTFEANLSYHSTAVNAVRFSPSGEELASGADGGEILLWRFVANKDGNLAWKVCKTLRFHPKDVLDLSWSADGLLLASGSVDNSCIIWDVQKGAPLQILKDHLHYVQGVAWDPIGHYLASISADRTCRIYGARSHKGKSQDCKPTYACQYVIMKTDISTVDTKEDDVKASTKSHLFVDETLPSFFRRLAWSPDGSFLLAPTGLYKTANGVTLNSAFAFSRKDLSRPVVQFPGATKAVVAVSFCPVIFALDDSPESPIFKLPYRLVFAVASINSVIIYDTEVLNPLAFLGGVHYGTITDLAWSADGKFLAVSSQDGYCTVIEFDEGELGEKLSVTKGMLQPQGSDQHREVKASAEEPQVQGQGASQLSEHEIRPTKARRITPVAIPDDKVQDMQVQPASII